MPAATFADVQRILNTLADTTDPDARDQVYGRHDAQGRFSWETEFDLLTAIADPRGTATRLIPYLDYASMTPDAVKANCTMLQKLITKQMPVMLAGTNRRYATGEEIDLMVEWLRGLAFPRRDIGG